MYDSAEERVSCQSDYEEDEQQERQQNQKLRQVKVVNTLNPSAQGGSAVSDFTRKTKLPGNKVRSAYQSAISFSKHLGDAVESDNEKDPMRFNDDDTPYPLGDVTQKLKHNKRTTQSKTTRTTSHKMPADRA